MVGDNAALSITGHLACLESDPAIRARADLYEPGAARIRDTLLKRTDDALMSPKEFGLEGLGAYSLSALQAAALRIKGKPSLPYYDYDGAIGLKVMPS